jgi:hypothetical protein
MLSSAETVCANPAPIACRLQSLPLWIPDPFEAGDSLQMPYRTVVWGVTLSAPFWWSFFLAWRALWNWWR